MFDGPIAVARTQPGSAPLAGVVAVVCVPSFRRPAMLRATLRSLCGQRDAPPFAVVVVDNDPSGREGAAAARTFFDGGALNGLSVVEAEPGNCRAINRAFDEARRRYAGADYFLMIDDDEVADPLWLARMIAGAEETGADIVGGPVEPSFPEGASPRLTRHPIYWPAFKESGPVAMIYGSGNFLIRRVAFDRLAEPHFDLAFNFLGGGDTEFFDRCRRAGLRFHWRCDARIAETVPADRLRRAWIVKRGLRIGAINFRIDRSNSAASGGRAWLFAKSAAIVALSPLRALGLAVRGEPMLVAAHPILIAIGRVLAAIGVEPQQYRAKPEAGR